MLTSSTLKRPYRVVRHALNCAGGRDLYIQRDARPTTEYHGTRYGGKSILADSLTASSNVVSVGIGCDASFDLSLIAKYDCTVHAYDPTPKSRDWVAREIVEPKFVFHPSALSNENGVMRLFLPAIDDNVSASSVRGTHTSERFVDVPCMTLQTVCDELGWKSIDLLKIDIEGAEYAVLSQSLETGSLDRVKQLVVEFHHFYREIGLEATKGMLATLRRAGWQVVWRGPYHHDVLLVR